MVKLIILLLLVTPIALYTDSCRQSKSPTSPNRNVVSNITPTPPAPNADSYDDVVIDFEACLPERRRIDVTYGSTTFEIVGKTEGGCLMRYGGEVENPNWDGSLNRTCMIPFRLGRQRFKKSAVGVDFSSIELYCSPRP